MSYTISIHKNKNGWLTGQCEQLPEAISEGCYMEHLMKNMREAIKEALEIRKEDFLANHKGERCSVNENLKDRWSYFGIDNRLSCCIIFTFDNWTIIRSFDNYIPFFENANLRFQEIKSLNGKKVSVGD